MTENVLTPEEFEERMIYIRNEYLDDWEMSHKEMDDCMIELLCSLGYEAGCEIFITTPKWNA